MNMKNYILTLLFLSIVVPLCQSQDYYLNKIEWIYKNKPNQWEYFDTVSIDLLRLGNFNGTFFIKNRSEEVGNTSIFIVHDDKIVKRFSDIDFIRFREVGIVDFDDHKDILIVGYNGGNGRCPVLTNSLLLYNPSINQVYSLEVNYGTCPPFTPAFNIEINKKLSQEQTVKEKNFLEDIKYEYDYYDSASLEKSNSDSRYMFEYWLLKNGKTEFGDLYIQKYAADTASVKFYNDIINSHDNENDLSYEIVKDGRKFYIGMEFSVLCFNQENNEIYTIFELNEGSDYISNILKYNNYLLIGSSKGKFVIINLVKETIKRYKGYSTIESIILAKDNIILNQKYKIALPDF